jgi:peptidoglycan-associated lipoprotein
MLVIALAATAALAAGCAEEPKPAPRLAQAPTMATDAMFRAAPVNQGAAAPARMDTASPTSGSVHIDDRIVKACGDLPEAHFAFDSSSVDASAASALDALGRCFTTGALRGRGMRLIGHTDPRGEVEYNLALGQRRAGSVAGYLHGRGVDRAKISATSHGEFDATGTDEAGWARDRKVDVVLAD